MLLVVIDWARCEEGVYVNDILEETPLCLRVRVHFLAQLYEVGRILLHKVFVKADRVGRCEKQ